MLNLEAGGKFLFHQVSGMLTVYIFIFTYNQNVLETTHNHNWHFDTFLFQVVFTPTHLVMLQTAVRNVQMVLTWHMTKNLENLYWTARHVLTVISKHVLSNVTKGFELSVCTYVTKCCPEAWKEWRKIEDRVRTVVFILRNKPSTCLETRPCVRFIVYGWFEDFFLTSRVLQ